MPTAPTPGLLEFNPGHTGPNRPAGPAPQASPPGSMLTPRLLLAGSCEIYRQPNPGARDSNPFSPPRSKDPICRAAAWKSAVFVGTVNHVAPPSFETWSVAPAT